MRQKRQSRQRDVRQVSSAAAGCRPSCAPRAAARCRRRWRRAASGRRAACLARASRPMSAHRRPRAAAPIPCARRRSWWIMALPASCAALGDLAVKLLSPSRISPEIGAIALHSSLTFPHLWLLSSGARSFRIRRAPSARFPERSRRPALRSRAQSCIVLQLRRGLAQRRHHRDIGGAFGDRVDAGRVREGVEIDRALVADGSAHRAVRASGSGCTAPTIRPSSRLP